jgi:hypothetical protein
LAATDSAITVPPESVDADLVEPVDGAVRISAASPDLGDGELADETRAVPLDLGSAGDQSGAPPPCQWQGLATAESYAFPGNVPFLRAADLDGNGWLDLAATSPYEGRYSVLLGAATGFAPVFDYALGNWASGIALADFDEDGHVDIALAESQTQLGPLDGIGIALNRGDGTFAAPEIVAGDRGFSDLAAGDLDGDGHVDLVAAGYSQTTGTASLAILRNAGHGVFEVLGNHVTGSTATNVVLADFDRDGWLDVALYSGQSNGGSIWRNQGQGALAQQASLFLGTGVFFITAADFDQDGYPDLAAANGDRNQVVVLRNLRDGTFATPLTYVAGAGAHQVAAGDVDGDGFPDIVVTNPGDQTIGFLRNRGDGTFAPALSYPTSYGPVALVIGDFDRDGAADVAVACVGGSLDLLRGRCR